MPATAAREPTELRPAARPLTVGPRHHFFGYYDKCPWDSSGRYALALEVPFMDRPPGGGDTATIAVVDTRANNQLMPIAQTAAWNWQQGCMLHWLPKPHVVGTASGAGRTAGGDPDRELIHNDRDGDRFVSIVRDWRSGTERVLPLPVYAVTRTGSAAVTLNFSRLHHQRPGYGYAGVPDPWEGQLAPADDGIYWMDLGSGAYRLIVSLAQMAAYRPEPSMEGAVHRFNHLLFAPDDSRFIFLHRWRRPGERRQRTRMFTARPDGSDVFLVADEGVSHFDWRDPGHVLAWARRSPLGARYYLLSDKVDEAAVLGEGVLTEDGHCSYGPNRRWVLTDTYPDDRHERTLLLYHPESGSRVNLGRFYSPPELDGEWRCDLHPRWSRDGRRVCFDSAHEGTRQMYVFDVAQWIDGEA